MGKNTEQAPQGPKLPVIAIVGRPNVGKSSLFNLVLGRRMSIVHSEAGVTRDRIVAPASWRGRHFQLIDTGGLGTYTQEVKGVSRWDIAIREQVEAAIDGSDIILFMVDAQEGFQPLDSEIAERLRASGKIIHLVANKADSGKQEASLHDFEKLGFDAVYPVSTLHRRGLDDLLEIVLKNEPVTSETRERKENHFRIAVIGRPNVGKSSLVNRLLGEERVLVSEIAGTTRDAVDVDFSLAYKGETIPVTLVDTAGLRKRGKVDNAVEVFSVMRAEAALKRADLVLFLIEAKPEGATSQDRHIAELVRESGKGCIIIANKWDSCKDVKQRDVLKELRYTLPQMDYAPLIFSCAVSGYNFNILLNTIAEVMAQMEIQVPTAMVNRVLTDAVSKNAPPAVGTEFLKIYYGTMVSNRPPRFALFVNKPRACAPNYYAYLVNYFRKSFDFTGLPIVLTIKARPRDPNRQAPPRPKREPSKRRRFPRH